MAELCPLKRVLLVPHPDRNTIIEEFEFIQSQIQAGNEYLRIRYACEKMSEQIDYFRLRAWNLGAKLWCGTIWMIENSDPIGRAWDDWWDQNLRFGMMDQLSLPVILDQHRIEPQSMAINLWRNDYFTYIQHAKKMQSE
jgi:hypothetical protein